MGMPFRCRGGECPDGGQRIWSFLVRRRWLHLLVSKRMGAIIIRLIKRRDSLAFVTSSFLSSWQPERERVAESSLLFPIWSRAPCLPSLSPHHCRSSLRFHFRFHFISQLQLQLPCFLRSSLDLFLLYLLLLLELIPFRQLAISMLLLPSEAQ